MNTMKQLIKFSYIHFWFEEKNNIQHKMEHEKFAKKSEIADIYQYLWNWAIVQVLVSLHK